MKTIMEKKTRQQTYGTRPDAKLTPATQIVRGATRVCPEESSVVATKDNVWGKNNNPDDVVLTQYEDGCTRQENTKTGQLILRDAKGVLMKGSILNPSGRGTSKNMTTILLQAIAQVGKGDPRKRQEKIVEKVIEMAEEGDKDMVKLVWEYMDGKAIQRVDHTSDGEGIQPMSKEQLDKLDKMFTKDEGHVVEVKAKEVRGVASDPLDLQK